MNIGTIVKLKIDCLGNAIGSIGVVYENYNIGEGNGVSVIFENGEYCGFSEIEQEEFFEEVGFTTDARIKTYNFTNVIKLSRDFESGLFDPVLKQRIGVA